MSKRALWESMYGNETESDRFWFIDRLPDQVLALLDGPDVTKERALDIGCGIGNLTMRLGRYFRTVAGIDFAEAGIHRAMSMARAAVEAPHFVVGDATRLPFEDGRFDYVLDRGCLQLIPTDRWPDYFSGVERVMTSGGHYQLFFRRDGATCGFRSTLHRYLRNPMKAFAVNPYSQARLLAKFPPALVCQTAENV